MTKTKFKYIDESGTADFPDPSKLQMEIVYQLKRIADALERANRQR